MLCILQYEYAVVTMGITYVRINTHTRYVLRFTSDIHVNSHTNLSPLLRRLNSASTPIRVTDNTTNETNQITEIVTFVAFKAENLPFSSVLMGEITS